MVGDNIRLLRKKYNMTIEELALSLESNYSTIAMYETNKRKPDYNMMDKIANYFNVSVDMLIGRRELIIDKNIDYIKVIKKAESLNISAKELDSLISTISKIKGKE
ncbi:MAG TPA: helix-turn-helix transcriptional regulator [Ruminiclostridium sp.]